MEIFEKLKTNLRGKEIKIVFPEPEDSRVFYAIKRLAAESLIEPILLGDIDKLEDKYHEKLEDFVIYNPKTDPRLEDFAQALYECRKNKITLDEARELVRDESYFGTMLVYLNLADGLVSGAIHSTGDTVRPALQIIKTKPNASRVSGSFLMLREEKCYIFADCAINVDPEAQVLAEIALDSAQTAKMFGLEPRVAMLSYSTRGTGTGPLVDKVKEATRIAKDLNVDEHILIDGEMQFDAAIDSTVAKLKAPDSPVAGQANVFVFPELEAGNIGYKIAQRLGGFEAVGPILQGLNKPVSDLSRGCNEEDVYKVSLITAAQAIGCY